MFNLFSEINGTFASGSYIGFETDDSAREIFEKICSLLWKNADNPFENNFSFKRVVVWFENYESKICSVAYINDPKFTESISGSNVSIFKRRELN